jgi:TonB family protein
MPEASAKDASGSEEQGQSEEQGERTRAISTSRWIDYDTHELLEMISELEDERRWSRLREGIWIAVLLHILLISAITWIPKYVFKVPPVIDPFNALKARDQMTRLELPEALRQLQKPKVEVKPLNKPPVIDRKTLEAMNKPPVTPQPTPEPKAEQPAAPVAPPTPQPAPPANPNALEAPVPRAVPARPNFNVGPASPDDQLRDAMRGSRSGSSDTQIPSGGLNRHPGAGAGGVEILSDRQGVDFNPWLRRWYYETEHTWDPLIPDEVNAPILKSGQVQIRFKVLPNGQVTDMHLEGRSGDTGLDRAAWGAITGSSYPPLPREFHGPYLELRAVFLYNMEPR